MKTIKIMSILTMLCAIFSCKAQNKGYNAWIDEGHKVVK